MSTLPQSPINPTPDDSLVRVTFMQTQFEGLLKHGPSPVDGQTVQSLMDSVRSGAPFDAKVLGLDFHQEQVHGKRVLYADVSPETAGALQHDSAKWGFPLQDWQLVTPGPSSAKPLDLEMLNQVHTFARFSEGFIPPVEAPQQGLSLPDSYNLSDVVRAVAATEQLPDPSTVQDIRIGFTEPQMLEWVDRGEASSAMQVADAVAALAVAEPFVLAAHGLEFHQVVNAGEEPFLYADVTRQEAAALTHFSDLQWANPIDWESQILDKTTNLPIDERTMDALFPASSPSPDLDNANLPGHLDRMEAEGIERWNTPVFPASMEPDQIDAFLRANDGSTSSIPLFPDSMTTDQIDAFLRANADSGTVPGAAFHDAAAELADASARADAIRESVIASVAPEVLNAAAQAASVLEAPQLVGQVEAILHPNDHEKAHLPEAHGNGPLHGNLDSELHQTPSTPTVEAADIPNVAAAAVEPLAAVTEAPEKIAEAIKTPEPAEAQSVDKAELLPNLKPQPEADAPTAFSLMYHHAKDWLGEHLSPDQLKTDLAGFLNTSHDLSGTMYAIERLSGMTIGTAFDAAEAVVKMAQEHMKPEPAQDMRTHIDSLVRAGDDPAATFRAVDEWTNAKKDPEQTEQNRLWTAEAVARKGAGEGLQPEAIASNLAMSLPNSNNPENAHSAVAARAYQAAHPETNMPAMPIPTREAHQPELAR